MVVVAKVKNETPLSHWGRFGFMYADTTIMSKSNPTLLDFSIV